MRKKIVCLIIALLLLTTGCNRKTVDDYNVQDNEQNKSQNDDISIKEDEIWVEDIDISLGKKINAKVTIPNTNSYKVLNATEKYFTEEDKKEILNGLSQGDIYKYEMEFYPKHELDLLISDIQNYLNGLPEGFSDTVEEEKLIIYEELYNTAPDSFVIADDYMEDCYVILYDDTEYVVEFTNDRDISLSQVSINLKDSRDAIDSTKYQNVVIADDIETTLVEENDCILSLDEAEKLALDLIGNISHEDFSLQYSQTLCLWGIYDDGQSCDSINNGYVLTFGRTIDEVNVLTNMFMSSSMIGKQAVEKEKIGDLGYSFYHNFEFEQIVVCVNDMGVVKLEYINPYVYQDAVTDNVSMLDFEKIKESVVNEIILKDYYKNVTFTDMSLKYMPVRSNDSEDNYSIIPVWILTDKDSNNVDSYVVVNAIDGSVINVGAQVLDVVID